MDLFLTLEDLSSLLSLTLHIIMESIRDIVDLLYHNTVMEVSLKQDLWRTFWSLETLATQITFWSTKRTLFSRSLEQAIYLEWMMTQYLLLELITKVKITKNY